MNTVHSILGRADTTRDRSRSFHSGFISFTSDEDKKVHDECILEKADEYNGSIVSNTWIAAFVFSRSPPSLSEMTAPFSYGILDSKWAPEKDATRVETTLSARWWPCGDLFPISYMGLMKDEPPIGLAIWMPACWPTGPRCVEKGTGDRKKTLLRLRHSVLADPNVDDSCSHLSHSWCHTV